MDETDAVSPSQFEESITSSRWWGSFERCHEDIHRHSANRCAHFLAEDYAITVVIKKAYQHRSFIHKVSKVSAVEFVQVSEKGIKKKYLFNRAHQI